MYLTLLVWVAANRSEIEPLCPVARSLWTCLAKSCCRVRGCGKGRREQTALVLQEIGAKPQLVNWSGPEGVSRVMVGQDLVLHVLEEDFLPVLK